MLHGYTDSSFSFSRALPLLDPGAPRLRARPARPRRLGATGGRLRAAAISPPTCSRSWTRSKLERATLVGHCMGSLVAQRVALEAPRRVERLVLVSSMTAARNIEGDGRAAAGGRVARRRGARRVRARVSGEHRLPSAARGLHGRRRGGEPEAARTRLARGARRAARGRAHVAARPHRSADADPVWRA